MRDGEAQFHEPALPGRSTVSLRSRGPYRPRWPAREERHRRPYAGPRWRLEAAMEVTESTQTAARRSYGSGSLYVRRDKAGCETWYGHWRADGTQLKRRIGDKRATGSRDGLTRTQAEAELRRQMAGVKPATHVSGDALTIADLGDRYLADLKRQGRKRATLVAVESAVRVWFRPFLVDKDLRKLKSEDVSDLIKLMETGKRPGPREIGDRRYGRPVGPKSIRNYIGTLSATLAFAVREGWLSSNVAQRAKLPAKQQTNEIRFLTADEVRLLVESAQAGDYHAIDRALYL